jgi:hypothetical protein
MTNVRSAEAQAQIKVEAAVADDSNTVVAPKSTTASRNIELLIENNSASAVSFSAAVVSAVIVAMNM